jgi:glycosyltransferase involved in cell wall biosynthesis
MKISIVTITYNRAHLIGETIQSVLDQTYSDFEYIIIDDGSTDTTEYVVRSFNDDRIKYYKYEKNDKRSFLRNEGIRKAKGELISILDSDDLWTKDKLETIHFIFNTNPEINFVIHNLAFIPEGLGIKDPFADFKADFYKNILDDLFSNKILPYSIFTVKKSTLDQIGLLDEEMVDGQHDLYLRVASQFKIYYCSKKMALIRKHEQNISRNVNMTHYGDYIKSLNKLRNQEAISNKKYLDLKNAIYTKIAYIYRKQERYNDAKENYIKAFQTKFLGYNGLKSFFMYLRISLLQ